MEEDSTPLISVTIPTFRRPEMLKRAVSSVRKQSFADWELVISDDEKTPGETWAFLCACAEEDARIRVFRHAGESGQIPNNNFAMEQARGKWIKPLFDDDELMETCLEVFAAAAEKQPDAALIRCPAEQRVLGKLQPVSRWEKMNPGGQKGSALTSEHFHDPNCDGENVQVLGLTLFCLPSDEVRVGLLRQQLRIGTPLQVMFPRRVLEAGLRWRRVEGMSSAFDSDFMYRMLDFGPVVFVDRPLVIQHLGHETGTALMDADPGKLDADLRLLMRELHAACDPALRPELNRCLHELELVRGLHRIGRYGRWKEGLRMILRPHPPSAWGHVLSLLLFQPDFRARKFSREGARKVLPL